RLPCDIAAVLPVPSDRRSVFVVPWGDEVYVGTTDTDYSGPIDDPRCEAEDVEYVLQAVNAWVTRPLSPADVTGVWAGLRPLLSNHGGRGARSARTADLSRRHQVSISPSGVVSVTGGKLTTYRKIAADTLEAVLGRRTRARLHDQEAAADAAPDVADLVAPELGWTPAETERQVVAFREAVDSDRAAARLARHHAGHRGA